MEKDNTASILDCTITEIVPGKLIGPRGILTHVKRVMPEPVVPRNKRFLRTRNAKNVHERHIEDEEPNGGGDLKGNVHQPSAYEDYDSVVEAVGLNFDDLNLKEPDSLPTIEMTNDPITVVAGICKYDQEDLSGSDDDGQNKSREGSSNSSVKLSGTPYGYPYRYR